MERERGQVLPLYAIGIGMLLMLLSFGLNYANVLTWQVRAQNAADAAAQSILAIQTQQFNNMEASLYATAIEEYRARMLLNGMIMAVHNQGGCFDPTQPATSVQAECESVYEALRPAFLLSVGRYTNDVELVNQITANMSFSSLQSDANALLGRLEDCNGPGSGDCAFNYTILSLVPRSGLGTVEMDALGILKPSLNTQPGPANENDQLFGPAQVEVAVCARVAPLFPSILGFTLPTFQASARSASAAVMVEEDWLQPGTIANPWTGNVFQPAEPALSGASDPLDDTGYDWYAVNYGGNRAEAFPSANGYREGLFVDEFSAQLGWWNSVPIHSYAGAATSKQLGCPS